MAAALQRDSEVIVVGSGPNGLAAAISLAQAGWRTTVVEAAATAGGGVRTAELTLPGFQHDICSAIHPLAAASPWFSRLPLAQHGLRWVHPAVPLAHPLDDGSAILLDSSLEATAAGLESDGVAYRSLLQPLVEAWDRLLALVLAPPRWPRQPGLAVRFGLRALQSAEGLARSHFRGERARALFAGLAAHSMLPLNRRATAGFGLILAAAAHAAGWPFPRGGAQKLSDSLVSYLRFLGGEVATGLRAESLADFADARVVLCDTSPGELARLAGNRLPGNYRRRLQRYRYGLAAFKVDWALAGPIPWRAPECTRAGTVHLGGSMEEIVASEHSAWAGEPAERPFVLLAQPSLFDPTRAPAGRHTAWAYCHVPNGSTFDMLGRIEAQVERFAPGFRRRILARSVMSPAALARHNPNLVGGDINGGVQDIGQMLRRPTLRHYSTPVPGLFLCSSSTPPGGGVHGMCGYFAAQRALNYLGKKK